MNLLDDAKEALESLDMYGRLTLSETSKLRFAIAEAEKQEPVAWEWTRLIEIAETEPNATPLLVDACRSVRVMLATPNHAPKEKPCPPT